MRAYALNASSVALLRGLKVWDALPAQAATPVYDMQIQGDLPGALLEFSAWEQQVGELAWITDAAVLERELGAAVRFSPHVTVTADAVDAPLLALCEGKASATRESFGVTFERHDYGHRAIAARLVSTRPHQGIARQWFNAPDVLALLPFDSPTPEASYALVWSLPEARAQSLLALDDAAFEQALMAACGGEAGELKLAAPRASWPLMLAQADAWCGPGWVLLGDAAHVVHPLAGQGLNLGLADVACAHARARAARSVAPARRREAAAPLCPRAPRAHLGDGPGDRRPAAPVFTRNARCPGTSQPRPDSRQPHHPGQTLAHRPRPRRLKGIPCDPSSNRLPPP